MNDATRHEIRQVIESITADVERLARLMPGAPLYARMGIETSIETLQLCVFPLELALLMSDEQRKHEGREDD